MIILTIQFCGMYHGGILPDLPRELPHFFPVSLQVARFEGNQHKRMVAGCSFCETCLVLSRNIWPTRHNIIYSFVATVGVVRLIHYNKCIAESAAKQIHFSR
jgi:hypothetical protein